MAQPVGNDTSCDTPELLFNKSIITNLFGCLTNITRKYDNQTISIDPHLNENLTIPGLVVKGQANIHGVHTDDSPFEDCKDAVLQDSLNLTLISFPNLRNATLCAFKIDNANRILIS
ncbi:hypothetical protein IFR04_007838 [Cadophora malorum]|uniref:Uncharacterized protein n=1 Tax=Cadophora malorum TaxID=108018 RepID=A0A8H7TG78_9HELO|nr:hypothetical protein IFR04_007838 [Cadophora malorum]